MTEDKPPASDETEPPASDAIGPTLTGVLDAIADSMAAALNTNDESANSTPEPLPSEEVSTDQAEQKNPESDEANNSESVDPSPSEEASTDQNEQKNPEPDKGDNPESTDPSPSGQAPTDQDEQKNPEPAEANNSESVDPSPPEQVPADQDEQENPELDKDNHPESTDAHSSGEVPIDQDEQEKHELDEDTNHEPTNALSSEEVSTDQDEHEKHELDEDPNVLPCLIQGPAMEIALIIDGDPNLSNLTDEFQQDQTNSLAEIQQDQTNIPDESQQDQINSPDESEQDQTNTPDKSQQDQTNVPDESQQDQINSPDESEQDQTNALDESQQKQFDVTEDSPESPQDEIHINDDSLESQEDGINFTDDSPDESQQEQIDTNVEESIESTMNDPLESKVDLVVETGEPPPIEEQEELLNYVRNEGLNSLLTDDYENARRYKITEDVLQNAIRAERMRTDTNSWIESIDSRIAGLNQKIQEVTNDWDKRISNSENEFSRRRDHMKAIHLEDEQDFEKRWSDTNYVGSFNKASPLLLQLRQVQRNQALSKDFDGALKTKAIADRRQQIEEGESLQRAIQTMKTEYTQMKARHQKEIDLAEEHRISQRESMEETKRHQIETLQLAIKQLQLRKSGPVPKLIGPAIVKPRAASATNTFTSKETRQNLFAYRTAQGKRQPRLRLPDLNVNEHIHPQRAKTQPFRPRTTKRFRGYR